MFRRKVRLRWGVSITLAALLPVIIFAASCAAPAGTVGPPGPAGPSGPPGPAGPAASVATAECSACHNDSTTLLAKQLQYQKSGHFLLGDFERNDAGCAVCHTSEGFTERIATNSIEIAGDIEDPTPQNCRTCHEIHTTFTEADYDLRVSGPVTLELTGDTIDLGEGNLCASCHQPRWSYEIPQAGGGDVEITSTRFGPHHGPQSTMLFGLAGYGEFKGSNVHAAVPDACVTCHMADAYGTQSGGHTWKMAYEYHGSEVANTAGCQSCHVDLEEFDRNGSQTEIQALIDELGELLVAEGLITESGLDGSGIPGTFSSEQAGALWNYKTVIEDKSVGVHNPQFAKFLLQTAIDALK